MRALAFVLPLLVLLGGCVIDDGGYPPSGGGPVYGGPDYGPPPPGSGLSRVQRLALDDGCVLRYNGIPDKLRRCLNGDPALFEDALADGCRHRYSGNRDKYRECMRPL